MKNPTFTFEFNGHLYTANKTLSSCYCDADRILKPEFLAAQAEHDLDEAAKKAQEEPKGEPKDNPEQGEPKDNPEQGEEKKEEAKAPKKKVAVTSEIEGYTVQTDNRGRMVWKSDKKIVIGCQPTKRGYFTIYINKCLLTKPEDVIAALKDTFEVSAVQNPTYVKTNGKDTYSVKATVDSITHADLPKLAGLLIEKAASKKPEKA